MGIHCKEELMQQEMESRSEHDATQGSPILSPRLVVGSNPLQSIGSVTQTLSAES